LCNSISIILKGAVPMQVPTKLFSWIVKPKQLMAAIAYVAIQVTIVNPVQAAIGDMGTGIPSRFGLYGQINNSGGTPYLIVWQLSSATTGFPAGCPVLYMFSSTMGIEGFKAAYSLIVSANLAGRPLRFFAHAERDGGCGIDYVQLG
jgi:hypothetical protein